MLVNYVGMLMQFHQKFEHYISLTPERHDTVPKKVFKLREKLIEEEFKEFQNAQTRVEIADALADLLYVVFGTCVSYGIPIDEVFAEVHRSNMTKSKFKSEYGKTKKGKNYEEPNLKPIIERALNNSVVDI
jgi:predicted HAD superfamily Cof-like phosphohydrolase